MTEADQKIFEPLGFVENYGGEITLHVGEDTLITIFNRDQVYLCHVVYIPAFIWGGSVLRVENQFIFQTAGDMYNYLEKAIPKMKYDEKMKRLEAAKARYRKELEEQLKKIYNGNLPQ